MAARASLTRNDIDLLRQEKAKEYARSGRHLLSLELALGSLYLLFLLAGPSPALAEAISGVIKSPTIVVALYFLAFALGYGLLLLPLQYYSGFILPHRYGLSTQDRKGWALDQIKGSLLSLTLGTMVMEALYWLLHHSPSWWWLWAGALMLLLTLLLSHLAPLLLFPLFFRLTPLADEELARRLTDLAQRAGTRVRGVFTIDFSRRTRAANALLIGLGNTRRIVLGDTILEDYSPEEIEVVFAHELGHHLHNDMARGIALQSALTLTGLCLAHLVLNRGAPNLGFQGPQDIAAFPLLALAMGTFLVVTSPLVNAYSRSRERAADRYALAATRKGEVFISLMVKLANQNLAEVEPAPWVEFLLHSHPAIGKRIEEGERFASLESPLAFAKQNHK